MAFANDFRDLSLEDSQLCMKGKILLASIKFATILQTDLNHEGRRFFCPERKGRQADARAFSEERLENEKCKFASFSFSPLFLPLPLLAKAAAAAVIMIPLLFVPQQPTTVEPKSALPLFPLSLSLCR